VVKSADHRAHKLGIQAYLSPFSVHGGKGK
jgi:hypothetical protein